MKYDNQLRYAVKIVETYNGREPLSAWLKEFFRHHKQMGSRDRKTVASLVYGYYRLGHVPFEKVEARILAAIPFRKDLAELNDYFKAAHTEFSHTQIFPWHDHLSDGIELVPFCASFLHQPDLFIRIRPGHEESVHQKLNRAELPFEIINKQCVALPNNTKLADIVSVNREAVIQDRSSQETGKFIVQTGQQVPSVWDCCAASGGKAIMAYDMISDIRLTVSDSRKSIMDKLAIRFQEAGINHYTSVVCDLTKTNPVFAGKNFDLIIADVPCSGSGTWSRTPEQLYFFEEGKIGYYQNLQQQIVGRVIPFLKKGAALLYITCSVFKEENERIAEYIQEKYSLKLLSMELIRGYDKKADTMFAALFTA